MLRLLAPAGTADDPGPRFVAGVFLHLAARRENLLVAEHGFPPEQHRLRISDDLGHPGWVVQHQQPLLLADTRDHPSFRQILKTARMGSAVYAPLVARERFFGQLIAAARVPDTMSQRDLDLLVILAGLTAEAFWARGGPEWLEAEAR